jgi:hypothetical protein
MEKADIFESNQNAVDRMGNGLYTEAIVVLQSALQTLLSRSPDEPDAAMVEESDKTPAETVEVVPSDCSAPSAVRSSFENNTFVIYDKPFRVLGSDNSIITSGRKHNQVSLTVIYNLALSFHLMAVKSATNQSKNLRTALNLYGMAFAVGQKSYESEIDRFLSMAILNNMGSIYSHFFNVEEMQHCLENLRFCLDSSNEYDEQIFDNDVPFHLNVTLLYGQNIVASPAA